MPSRRFNQGRHSGASIMQKINLLDAVHQQFTALLGNTRAEFDIQYNATCDRWYMEISVDDDCVGSFKIVDDSLLMRHCATSDFGDFVAVGTDLGRNGFTSGNLCLFYVTPAEAEILEANGY